MINLMKKRNLISQLLLSEPIIIFLFKHKGNCSATMKVDPVVSNNDELFITNMAHIQKIKYLETEKCKRQEFIKDLSETLLLNKQSLSLLALNQKQPALKNLNNENNLLQSKLKKYYEDYMNVNSLLLIEQQLRMEEKKFYAERILQFQINMIELRKYLQDKQQSFSSVVSRLKKYEQLSELTLETKLHKIGNQLSQPHIEQIIKSIIVEKEKYKSVWETCRLQLNDLALLKSCLEKKTTYQSMKLVYHKLKEKQAKEGKQDKQRGISFYEKSKNTTNSTSNTFNKNFQSNQFSSTQSPAIKNTHRQLIRLLKKEKINNQILQSALNQAIEKNQQLILQNNELTSAYENLQVAVQRLESKAYLLEQELTKKERSLAWDQKWKSKCELIRQKRVKQFEQKGDQDKICLIKLHEDMERLSSFLITCIPKGGLVKSSSSPNFVALSQDLMEQNDDSIEIQEL